MTDAYHPGCAWCAATWQRNWQVAMHLAGRHADPMAIARSTAGNTDAHDHEHTGPGTIRDHDRNDLSFDPERVEANLEEMESSP